MSQLGLRSICHLRLSKIKLNRNFGSRDGIDLLTLCHWKDAISIPYSLSIISKTVRGWGENENDNIAIKLLSLLTLISMIIAGLNGLNEKEKGKKKRKEKRHSFGAGNQDDRKNENATTAAAVAAAVATAQPATATHQRTWAPHNMIALSPTAYHVVLCLVCLSLTNAPSVKPHWFPIFELDEIPRSRINVHLCVFSIFLSLSLSLSLLRENECTSVLNSPATWYHPAQILVRIVERSRGK